VSATTGFDVGSRSQSVPVSPDGGHGAGALLRAGRVEEEGDAAGADGEGRDVEAGADEAACADDAAGVGEGTAVIDGVCIVGGGIVGVGPATDVPAPEPQPLSTSRTAAVQTASPRPRARRTAPWSTRQGAGTSAERHDVSTLSSDRPAGRAERAVRGRRSRRQAQSRYGLVR
jgi:hypothetical protein